MFFLSAYSHAQELFSSFFPLETPGRHKKEQMQFHFVLFMCGNYFRSDLQIFVHEILGVFFFFFWELSEYNNVNEEWKMNNNSRTLQMNQLYSNKSNTHTNTQHVGCTESYLSPCLSHQYITQFVCALHSLLKRKA